jgi:predicted RNase H-like HicB family nuclease
MNFRVLLHPKEDGWIVAEAPELPGCISQGKTEPEARANMEEAIAAWLWAEEQKSGIHQRNSC